MISLPTSYIVPYFAAKATDQGARGTCAVFSSISLLEYYFANKIKFSPQFLYACCKLAEDTENTKFAGTSIKNIFDCIQQFGGFLLNDGRTILTKQKMKLKLQYRALRSLRQ